MTLHKIQADFADSLLRQKQTLPTEESAFASLFESGGASFEFRHNIYHNNVIGTLARGLADKFPMLNVLLGDDYLMQCARAYVIQSPPDNARLAQYGETFPDFLNGRDELKTMPWLYDIALYETALFLCETSDDDTALTIEELQSTMGGESPFLSLRSSAKPCRFSYDPAPLIAFCASHGEGNKPDLTICNTYILFLRPHLETLTIQLSHPEYIFLHALYQSPDLHGALNAALTCDPTFDLAAVLHRHITLGTYVSRETKREHSK